MLTNMIELIQSFERESTWVSAPTSHLADEITIVVDGEGFLTTEHEQISFKRGTAFLIPTWTIHGTTLLQHTTFLVIHFFSERISASMKSLYHPLFDIQHSGIQSIQLYDDQMCDYDFYFNKLKKEVFAALPQRDDAIRTHLEAILLMLFRSFQTLPSTQGPLYKVMIQAGKVLEDHFSDSLRIEDLAANNFLSESYFRQKFKEFYGYSPKQYLMNIRINEAKRLLLSSSKNITEIAKTIGFSTVHQFNSIFSEREGLPPKVWRLQQRHKPEPKFY